MIQQKIGKIRIETGLESQRIQKIQEKGNIFYTINGGLYIGDGISYGGIKIANKCYVVNTSLTSVPTFATNGDIIVNKFTGYNYIVSLSGSNLYLNTIGSNFDISSLSSLPVAVNSVSASSFHSSVVMPNGGISLDPISGLYVNYDSNTLTISGGKLTLVSQSLPQINYTYNTINGGIYDGINDKLSVDVDNTTIKIVNNQLSAIGNASVDVIDSSIYSSYIASDLIANTFVSFDGSVNTTQLNPGVGVRITIPANSTNFTLVSTGFTFRTSDIGTVFRVINYNNGLNTNSILAISGLKITSIQGSSAFGVLYGGVSQNEININGTGTNVGFTIQYEPKIRSSQNVKWVKKNGIGDYTICFENNFDNDRYGMTFSTKGVDSNGEFGRQTTAHIIKAGNNRFGGVNIVPLSTNYARIETGYHINLFNNMIWDRNDCSVLCVNFIANKSY